MHEACSIGLQGLGKGAREDVCVWGGGGRDSTPCGVACVFFVRDDVGVSSCGAFQKVQCWRLEVSSGAVPPASPSRVSRAFIGSLPLCGVVYFFLASQGTNLAHTYIPPFSSVTRVLLVIFVPRPIPAGPTKQTQACSDSPSSSNRLLLALCQNACASCGSGNGQDVSATAEPSAAAGAGQGTCGGAGFSPVRVTPASFATLATLLRASLDQAASDREFLQARNCLVTAALYAVDGAEYVSWLRGQSGGGGSSGESLSSAVMADSELVSAAEKLDEAAAAATGGCEGAVSSGEGEGAGEHRAGVDYLLLRELRRHSVWATIELWEVSMSDSVVMAMEGGGARAERWLPRSVVTGLREVFYMPPLICMRHFFSFCWFKRLCCLVFIVALSLDDSCFWWGGWVIPWELTGHELLCLDIDFSCGQTRLFFFLRALAASCAAASSICLLAYVLRFCLSAI